LPAPFSSSEDALDGAVHEGDDGSEQGERELEGSQVEEDASPPAFEARRGVVLTATRARGRVPYLLDDVIKAQRVVMAAERDLSKAVGRARAHGATWEEVGLAVGMTRQGATKRFR